MNRQVLFLRIAAALAALQAAGHTFLMLNPKNTFGEAQQVVTDVMKNSVFDFQRIGSPHSYWDLYMGYGLIAAATTFFEAAILWILSRRPDKHVTMVFVASNIVHAIMVWNYFAFLIPITFDVLVAGCLIVSLTKSSAVE